MVRYDRRIRVAAACLTAAAGFVDAVGYLYLGGYFVSFMSGNSTQMAVAVAGTHWKPAALAAALIGLFVVGVTGGSLVGAILSVHRRSAVLLFVAGLLALAAMSAFCGWRHGSIAFATLAMGAENAVFERDGEIIGLTYMTGTLVKLGQRLAGALRGEDPWAWFPYFSSWAGLVCGALVGACAYPKFGLTALGFAALAMAALGLVIMRLDNQDPAERPASSS